MFKVSQSKVNQWDRCGLQFHRQNIDHLKRKRTPRPLKFGSIVHKLQEATIDGRDPYKVLKEIGEHGKQMFLEEREAYGDIITDIGYIFRAYQKFWVREPLKIIPVGKKKAEHPFEVEIVKGEIVAKGTIDGLTQHKKFKALLEHKNHKSIPNDDHRWRNLQSIIYIRVCDILGWAKLEGTLWNYIRSKPPTRPEILKAGGLSQRRIDTLPDVVIDVIKANKLKPGDYSEFIATQEAGLSSWFQRVFTPVKKPVADSLWKEFVLKSQRMASYYDKTSAEPPRSIGQHCSWCAYEPLCRAELQGNDVDFVLEHEYVVDESDYQTDGEYDADED